MNERPKPGEDENDLLKLQQQFLSSGSSFQPSVTIKRPDKRKTGGTDEQNRDVVKMEGIEDYSTLKAESVIPAKKSKFRSELPMKPTEPKQKETRSNIMEEEEDVEELLDRHDTGLAAVLSTIIERDTRNQMCTAPVLGKQGFPRVVHMDAALKDQAQIAPSQGKTKRKSLFAQQVEARGSKHFGVEAAPLTSVSRDKINSPIGNTSKSSHVLSRLQGPCAVDGAGLSISNYHSESQKIHEENVKKLEAMTEDDILAEQRKLLEMIDPKLVEFLKNKRKMKEEQMKDTEEAVAKEESFSVQKELKKKQTVTEPELTLPIQPSNKWLHMSQVEKDKLEWMKDLCPPSSTSAATGRQARFDFKGNLIAVDADVPVNIGLHHHGEEPERAGYTLEELFQLARSSNLQQRSLALHTMARIIERAKSGYLSVQVETAIIPSILNGGVVMLLRWALDDSVEAAVAAAIDALHSLICSPTDEDAVDTTLASYLGHLLPVLTPTATLEKAAQPEELDEDNKEEETDGDVINRDVIQALVTRMELLVRFRYIFDSMKPQAVTVVQLLKILSRVAQHSSSLAYEIIKCPGLVEKIVKEFLPTAWSPREPFEMVSYVYGLPVPAAMHLIRVLCQAGQNIAAILVSRFHLNVILLRYLAVQTSDLHLPQMEAAHLQAESLTVWRVCMAYGLTVQTYFDLYSNILPALGKLETTCVQELNVGLLCVLEKVVCVAGSSKLQQGFSEISENVSKGDRANQPINWSHVTALFQPIKVCVVEMLKDIGSSYPQKKHDLALPTVCTNFLATYFELESRQSGIDVVSSLEGIEQLSSKCILPFLKSFGFAVIMEKLSSYSNLLVSNATLPLDSAPNLPSLNVVKVLKIEETPPPEQSSNPETWTISMPILLPHSPFGFLTSILRLILGMCKRHKDMIPHLVSSIVNNKDLLMYMRKVCAAHESWLATAFFTRGENLFHYYWLKCCTLMPCLDMSLAHSVALRLTSRAQYGDEYLVHDLISTVVFSSNFISEGEGIQIASEAMASLSLSETLHLKSATQEQINVRQRQLLQEAYSSLARIRGHFLMAFGGMEKAVQESRKLYLGNTMNISSQTVNCSGESLMPRDWVFMPLIHVYNKAIQTKSVSGASMSPQAIAMVTSVLQWNYALEIWRPEEMSKLSVTLKLSRVMCAFIAGSDLFLEKPVNQYLAGILRVFSSQKVLDRLDFEEKIPGITSFYDLYQEFLDHYEAVSFGDPVFALYVLLPLQQKHSCMLRKGLWGERRKMLRTLRVPLTEMLIPLQNYLQPEEKDTELIQLYLSALITQALQASRSPILYLLAVHHTNRFIYTTQDDGNVAVRKHMWAQVILKEDKLGDVIYFKQADPALPRGISLYENLPLNRQKTLEAYRVEFKG